MTGYARIDYGGTPSRVVGMDDRRACADKPTWQWFALPIRREAGSDPDLPATEIPYPGGDDAAVRRAGHQRALITCSHCPLVLRCLQASWHTEEYGTYGAVSEVERFVLGGRGHSTSSARTLTAYDRTLAKITKRFGSDQHPVVRWIVAQGLPRGLTRDEPAETEGAA